MTLVKKFIVLLFFIMCICLLANAQGDFSEDRESSRYNVNQFGIKINTNGFGFMYTFAQRVNYRLRRNYEVEYDYVSSPKEVKMINTYFASYSHNVKRFVFGKDNSVHNIRTGYGYNWMMFEKRDKNSVSIHLQANVGFSFAFEKPIYYEMVDSVTVFNNAANYHYSPHRFEDYCTGMVSDIITKAPFTVGFKEIKVRPGNYIKLDFSFDFAHNAMTVSAIEVGGIVDFYYFPVTIMYNQPHNFMWSMYIAYQFGRKYNPNLSREYRREQRKLQK